MTGLRIELFLADGLPGGIMTAGVAGWTGGVLSGPRARLGELLERPETLGNGLYLLLDDPGRGAPQTCAAIGPLADLVGATLPSSTHEGAWNRLVVLTASDDAFTGAHWAYLESLLVELASQAPGALTTGAPAPRTPPIREAQVSDVQSFLAKLLVILPVLGVDAVTGRSGAEPPPSSGQPQPAGRLRSAGQLRSAGAGDAAWESGTDESPVFSFVDPRRRVDARGRIREGGFVLMAGSRVVPEWTNTGRTPATVKSYAAYQAQYDALVADGSIVVEGGQGRVTRDIAFATPSTAGAIAIGHSCNGPRYWKWKGRSYAAWLAEHPQES